NYRGFGKVHIEVTFDGKLVHDERLDSSEDLPEAERRWHFAELSLGNTKTVTLAATYEPAGTAGIRSRENEAGNGPVEPPAVGWGKLEIRVPRARHRRAPDPEHPSVVMILIDTLRADALSTYGNERVHSPEIDAVAKRGTVFEQAFAAASWTSPSTASIFTALPPPAHNLSFHSTHDPSRTGAFLAHRLITLPELFERGGFATAGFSCNPLVSPTYNFGQGFEYFKTYRWKQAHDGVVEESLAWIEKHVDERFFLYLHLVDPHAPYLPEDDLPLEGSLDEGVSLNGLYDGTVKRGMMSGDMSRTELEMISEKAERMYFGEVASVDRQIGVIVERLQSLGLSDKTVIAITSDHGEEFLEHDLIGHVNQLFEESVRIPLILAGPGVPQGERVEAPVENRHIGATLLSLADIPGDKDFEGWNLLSPVERERNKAPIFFTTRNAHYRRTGTERWMPYDNLHGVLHNQLLMLWSPPGPKWDRQHHALFDLSVDPDAKIDIYDQRRAEGKTLRKMIERWLLEGEARAPVSQEASESKLEMLRGLGYLDDE
ncbi:MAG: arylsulfatase A-like enzyme, partial [Planctomycetota bacterium]